MSEAKNPSFERAAIPIIHSAPDPQAQLLAAMHALQGEVKALRAQVAEAQAQLTTITTRLFSR